MPNLLGIKHVAYKVNRLFARRNLTGHHNLVLRRAPAELSSRATARVVYLLVFLHITVGHANRAVRGTGNHRGERVRLIGCGTNELAAVEQQNVVRHRRDTAIRRGRTRNRVNPRQLSTGVIALVRARNVRPLIPLALILQLAQSLQTPTVDAESDAQVESFFDSDLESDFDSEVFDSDAVGSA